LGAIWSQTDPIIKKDNNYQPMQSVIYLFAPFSSYVIGDSLPAFINIFSFILATASLISYRKRGYPLTKPC
jgi:hypothetical protein